MGRKSLGIEWTAHKQPTDFAESAYRRKNAAHTAGLTYPDKQIDTVDLDSVGVYTISADVDYTGLNVDSSD